MVAIFSCEAARAKVRHEDEHEAVKEQAHIGGDAVGKMGEAQQLWDGDEDGSANERAFEIANTADDDHAEHEYALIERGGRWVDVADVARVESAGDGGETAGEGEGFALRFPRVFSHRTSGKLVVAQAFEQASPRCADETPDDERADTRDGDVSSPPFEIPANQPLYLR